jgi:hypothetical protein
MYRYQIFYRIARRNSDFGGNVGIFTESVAPELVFSRMQEIINEHDENTCGGRMGGIPKHAQFFPLKKLHLDYSI